jgi:hypothetical protein
MNQFRNGANWALAIGVCLTVCQADPTVSSDKVTELMAKMVKN